MVQALGKSEIEQIGMIVAVTEADWVMGVNDRPSGSIPWHYSADLRRFKRLTEGGTIIMGRRTFQSIGRPLPRRRNIVITRQTDLHEGVECFKSVEAALETCSGAVWLIGGAQIYAEGMRHADFIDMTVVPDRVDGVAADKVFFPKIDLEVFDEGPLMDFEDEPKLRRRVYRRKP